MFRIFIFMLGFWSVVPQIANGSDVRRTKFTDGLWGTWAPNPESCDGKDASSVSISETQFNGSEGKCDVLWIIERPAERGSPTYGVHARCIDPKQPSAPRIVDLVFWPQAKDKIQIGKGFNELTTYQRCTAR